MSAVDLERPEGPTALPIAGGRASNWNLLPPVRALADQAFSRAGGAPLIPGNAVRLLKDAAENYPAWLDAIHGARRFVHFESYFIYDDDVGREFAEALIARARDGVEVRVLYDWMGGLGKTWPRYWRRLRAAGIEVRCFNPPRLDSPFGWVSRDHRKTIVVDGTVGFVSGLCVGRMWAGQPERGIEPWRDTGVEVRGPAVAEIAHGFADVWDKAGTPSPAPPALDPAPAGEVTLRVVATTPGSAGVFRLDQLIAALARKALWLTDAYFVGTAAYIEALRAAAQDGVDVRLLVPGPSDLPFVRQLSVAGYHPLLEAGVRVFEWKGPMLHAKTAVADGRWARVGSSNLNLASWMGNHEMDVVVEDAAFAGQMERMYEEDLANSTEIVLAPGSRRRMRDRPAQSSLRGGLRVRRGRGSAGRLAAGAMRIGHAIGAAASDRRVLAPTEARTITVIGLLLLALAVVAIIWPLVVAIPFLVVAGWIAIGLLLRGHRLRARSKTPKAKAPAVPPAPEPAATAGEPTRG